MTTTLYILPQCSSASGLSFTSNGPPARDNVNCITLRFSSVEYNADLADANPGFTVNTNVVLFGLSDTDAEWNSPTSLMPRAGNAGFLIGLPHIMSSTTPA